MVEKQQAANTLLALAAGAEGRSQSSRLRDLVTEVDAALAAGVRRKTILDMLHRDHGFTMTMSGFEKALRRARQQNPTSEAGQKQANTGLVRAILPEHLLEVKPAVQEIGTSVMSAKPSSQPQVERKPAGLSLDGRNITYKQRVKELKIKTLAELDKDEFVDQYLYDEKKGDGHENNGA